jgi:hypothetical protein
MELFQGDEMCKKNLVADIVQHFYGPEDKVDVKNAESGSSGSEKGSPPSNEVNKSLNLVF